MKNSRADKITFLLSADWFAPFWSLMAIVLSPSKTGELQRECRLIVKEIMGGQSLYWEISFSDSRIAHTQGSLISLVNRHALASNIEFSKFLEDGMTEESKEIMLISTITPMLFGDAEFIRQAGLTLDEMRLLQCKWEHAMGRVEALRDAEICVSEWDRYLVSLTPDIPSMLKDFAIEQLAARGAILEFWSAVLTLPSDSQNAFLEKYRILGAHLANVSLNLGWLPGGLALPEGN